MRKWLCAVTILAACGPSGQVTDANLDGFPAYQRARKTAEMGDFRAAAGFYEQVILAAPTAARPRLELGLLYDEKIGDPIVAIYQYRQYMALQPDPDKRKLAEDFIERCKLALAAKLPTSPGIDPAELTRLQTENAALRGQVAELQSRLARATTPLPVEASKTDTQPPPVAVPAETRTHIVQKGDTLQSLALRYYGTRSSWEKIFAANRAILPSKDQLKVGQQLVIP
jgi:LysM repeat protein